MQIATFLSFFTIFFATTNADILQYTTAPPTLCLPSWLNSLGKCMVHLIMLETEHHLPWFYGDYQGPDTAYEVSPLEVPVVQTRLTYRRVVDIRNWSSKTVFDCSSLGPEVASLNPVWLETEKAYRFQGKPHNQKCEVLVFVAPINCKDNWLRGTGNYNPFLPSDFYQLYFRAYHENFTMTDKPNRVVLILSEIHSPQFGGKSFIHHLDHATTNSGFSYEVLPQKFFLGIKQSLGLSRNICKFVVLQEFLVEAQRDCNVALNRWLMSGFKFVTSITGTLFATQAQICDRGIKMESDCYFLKTIDLNEMMVLGKIGKGQAVVVPTELDIIDESVGKMGTYKAWPPQYLTDLTFRLSLDFIFANIVFSNATFHYHAVDEPALECGVNGVGKVKLVGPVLHFVRSTVASTRWSFSEKGIHFVTCAGRTTVGDISFEGYVSAFERHIWVLILLSGLASTLAFYFLARHRTRRRRGRVLLTVFVYQILLEQSSNAMNKKARWLTGTWALVGIVLSSLYRRDNINQLIAPLPIFNVETFEQVVESNLSTITMERVRKSMYVSQLNINTLTKLFGATDPKQLGVQLFDNNLVTNPEAYFYNMSFLERLLRVGVVKLSNTQLGVLQKLERPKSPYDKLLMANVSVMTDEIAKCAKHVFVDTYRNVKVVFEGVRNKLLSLATREQQQKSVAISKEPLANVYRNWRVMNLPSGTDLSSRFSVLEEAGIAHVWHKWDERMLSINQTKYFAANYVPVRKVAMRDNIVSIFIIHGGLLIFAVIAFLCETLPWTLAWLKRKITVIIEVALRTLMIFRTSFVRCRITGVLNGVMVAATAVKTGFVRIYNTYIRRIQY